MASVSLGYSNYIAAVCCFGYLSSIGHGFILFDLLVNRTTRVVYCKSINTLSWFSRFSERERFIRRTSLGDFLTRTNHHPDQERYRLVSHSIHILICVYNMFHAMLDVPLTGTGPYVVLWFMFRNKH